VREWWTYGAVFVAKAQRTTNEIKDNLSKNVGDYNKVLSWKPVEPEDSHT